jgi:NAD(P)-dependent dehydrogenase (short-subunit alcohol dehydrogenase family)
MATYLITGANRGIGLELTRVLLGRDALVIATARDPGAATALNALGVGATGKLEVVRLDVADAATFPVLEAAVAGRQIDMLIANAGVSGPRGALDDAGNTADAWAKIFAVNVTGAFLTLKTCVPKLAQGGKVAILSSVMASSSNVSGASYPYRASKAAVANIGANLAVELKPRGIAVGVYHPGWVKTDMGGPGAAISPDVSAAGLVQRFDLLSMATTGVFEDYAGKRIEF